MTGLCSRLADVGVGGQKLLWLSLLGLVPERVRPADGDGHDGKVRFRATALSGT